MNTVIKDFLETVGLDILMMFLSDDAKINTKTLEITDNGNTVRIDPYYDHVSCIRNGEIRSLYYPNDTYENPIDNAQREYWNTLWFDVPEGVQLAYRAVCAGETLGIKDPDELDRLINKEKRFIKYVSNPEVYCNDRESKIADAKEYIVKFEKMKNELICWSDGRKELLESIAD